MAREAGRRAFLSCKLNHCASPGVMICGGGGNVFREPYLHTTYSETQCKFAVEGHRPGRQGRGLKALG